MKQRFGKSRCILAGWVLALVFGLTATASAQMKCGRDMNDFAKSFKLATPAAFQGLKVTLIATNAPGCLYYPGQRPEITVQVENISGKALIIDGRCDFVRFATLGIPGDIWLPRVEVLQDLPSLPVSLNLSADGYVNLVLRPELPEQKGGYGLILDFGEYGRDFIAGLARVFQPDPQRLQYPKQSLDSLNPAVLERLGVQAVRCEWPYVQTQDKSYPAQMQRLDQMLDDYKEHKVTVALQLGAGTYPTPLNDGAMRTFLNEKGVMNGRKGDLCWMPQDDPDFEEYLFRILCKHGWPKGPITAVLLWNEPWEGVSISGWGADMLRYRSIYRHMASAVLRAGKDAGVDVLVGGGDSSSNAIDKLFPDGTSEFLPIYDFCSIHYQGMSAPVLHKMWNQRKDRKGRVLIWDTESWVANSDDRIAGLVASNRAAGYDRSLGVFFGNLCTQLSHNQIVRDKIRDGDKQVQNVRPLHVWSAAATISAVQHFLGERDFSEILLKNALPWIYVFRGMKGNPDDGTVVVVGDIGQLFDIDKVLYRTVRPESEVREKMALHARLQALPANDPQRAELEKELAARKPFHGVSLTLADGNGDFQLYDFYGNAVPAQEGKIVLPLDARGYFLRATPAKPGSFQRLLEALRQGRVDGLQPVEIIAHDPQAALAQHPAVRLTVSNMLNRPLKGSLRAQIPGLTLEAPATLELAPYEKREISLTVQAGQETPDNTYPLAAEFDFGADGAAALYENLHINLIRRANITVDGKLDDWKGAYPQILRGNEKAGRSLTEAAWLPFVAFEAGSDSGYACGYLAYDEQNFYFAAKIADNTPDAGLPRFATRDDDSFFYPEVCFRNVEEKKDGKVVAEKLLELKWKEGVRRYSYRRGPVLPDGASPRHDNVQIAFNAVPEGSKDDWEAFLPGRMPKFVSYKDTDYEYALNKVAGEFGGGTEVWRLQAPGMPRIHFYPRQPKNPLAGAVTDARLVAVHENGTRITEASIPWAELPEVKKLLDAGKPVKFSFRVNDNSGGPLLELAKDRSVSRLNNPAFHPDWQNHWANEVEFSFEK